MCGMLAAAGRDTQQQKAGIDGESDSEGDRTVAAFVIPPVARRYSALLRLNPVGFPPVSP